MIANTQSVVAPAIAFASADGTTLQITNIVPGNVSQIGIEEYNGILGQFAKRFIQFCRDRKLGVHCVQTSDALTLTSAIPGEKTRGFFNRYLALHPTSYHPLDIERLDVFICASYRYCRKTINVDRLRRYLIEVLKWKEDDANWCCNRIKTGMDILKVNKKFSA
ncbi:MAG: hypothetical protein FD174_932 [Geobacteraceae bacterium]|nr:MAG: hypothetical protein FD174_932 [Geobacteraceae bacterium]